MANDVEVTNFGEGGVASEATLASIKRSIERMARNSGRNGSSDSAEVQRRYNNAQRNGIRISTENSDALRDNTDATEDLTKAKRNYSRALVGVMGGLLGSVSGSIAGFSDAVISGKSELSDFAQHIPLIGSSLTIFTGLIDENIDNFRQLSQVGATFGNGLNDIRQIAAQASMPLDDFVSLISENSDTMKLFGSDVSAGARSFSTMSKELRQGPGRSLINLGYTSTELNQLLLDQAEIQAQTFNRDRIRQRVTAKSAAEFGMQLQGLAAISGKRRDQIKDEMKQQSADIRMMAATSRMNQEDAESFRANLGTIGSASSTLQNALLDFSDGIPTDDVTRQLMRVSDTFANQGQSIQDMDPRELHNFVVGVRSDLQEYADSLGKPLSEVSSAVPGLAEALNMQGELSKYNQELTRKDNVLLLLKQAQEQKAQTSLKNFQDTMNDLRGQLMTAFINSGVLEKITVMMNSLGERLETFIKSDSFDNLLSTLEGYLKNFTNAISTFVGNFQKYDLKTALFGNEDARVTGLISSDVMSGLVDNISDSLGETLKTHGKELFSSVSQQIGESLKSVLKEHGLVIAGGLAAVLAGPAVVSGLTKALGRLVFGGGPGDDGGGPGGDNGRRRSSGLGKLGKDIGKFAGNIGAGVMKGAAQGLKAFASPKVAIGAGMLGAAITIIGAGIAGATWIMGKTLPTLTEGLQGFQEIDGTKLADAGDGLIQLSAGLGAFGSGSAAAGVGLFVENIASLFGGKSPIEKLESFQKVDIDKKKVINNASALSAFSQAISGFQGVPNKGLFESLGNAIFGITKDNPIDELKKFSETEVSTDIVANNARALTSFSQALSNFQGVPSKGLFESLSDAIFGITKDNPIDELKKFSETEVSTDIVANNARALSLFSQAVGNFQGVPSKGLFESLGDAIFGITKGNPIDELKKFSETEISPNIVANNARALSLFSQVVSNFQGVPSKGLFESLGNAIFGITKDNPIDQLRKFGETEVPLLAVKNNAQSLSAFSQAISSFQGVPSKGLFESFSGAISGLFNDDPMSKLREFSTTEISTDSVINNARALSAFSQAISSFQGVPSKGLFESLGNAIFGITKDNPMAKLKEFSTTEISTDSVINNAQALTSFSQALSNFQGVPSKGLFESLGGAISGLFNNNPMTQLKEFGDIELNKTGVQTNASALSQFSESLSGLSSIDSDSLDIPRSLYRGLSSLSTISGDSLKDTAVGMQSIASVRSLETNINTLKNGFDSDSVNNYNDALENLVETLNDLNQALAEDNEGGIFDKGTGVASADVLKNINMSTSGSAEGMTQLNRLMSQVLVTLKEIAEDSDKIEKNTKSTGTNIANGQVSSVR